MIDRRTMLAGGLAAGASAIAGGGAAQTHFYKAITGDDGAPVPNYLVPAGLSTDALPGVVWTGGESADVILVEFFDYNCPFCRRAATDLEAMLKEDGDLRVGLVNNPVLSPQSLEAAKVQQAVMKLYGPRAALALHLAMFGARRPNNRDTALAAAKRLGLDDTKVAEASEGADVGRVLERQRKLAEALGFSATPSFLLKTVGILGYPGRLAMRKMVASVRSCDQIACG
jgi:protein-disulfide isomerase